LATCIEIENEIWRSICRGEIAGEWRSESLLASELSVSPVLLREAVDNLVGVGLLNRLPGHGVRLSDSALHSAAKVRGRFGEVSRPRTRIDDPGRRADDQLMYMPPLTGRLAPVI
jgi:DNA-binding GntR family transcriptional regulator